MGGSISADEGPRETREATPLNEVIRKVLKMCLRENGSEKKTLKKAEHYTREQT